MHYKLVQHNSSFLLVTLVPSVSSVLPVPLQTFCCTRTQPSLISVSSLFHVLGSHNSFSLRKEVSVFSSVSHICTLACSELLFSLSDTHSCYCLWQDCSCRCSSVPRLSPFVSKVLTCTSLSALCKITSNIKKKIKSFPMCSFFLAFPSLQAFSLATGKFPNSTHP